MKNLAIIILLITTVLTSCKNTENKVEITTSKEVVKEQETDILSTAWMDNIQLNNGVKWEANAETNKGVQEMQNSLKTQVVSTLEDYHKLAELLNNDKNYVIKNCTMKGASHDNLHVWLLPLMAKIDVLSETKTIEDASKLKHSIEENINIYQTYFQ
jgi:hypothetical protein